MNSGRGITAIQQFAAEMAVATESHKTVLNMASTFWSILQRLHIRGSEGIEMLKNDLNNNYNDKFNDDFTALAKKYDQWREEEQENQSTSHDGNNNN